MISILSALVLGFGLAAGTYLLLERGGRRMLLPLLARGVAWSALILLLINAAFTRSPRGLHPIVLLDASLSMQAAGAHWPVARDSAHRLGEIRYFGDERPRTDTLPDRGESRLLPALTASAVSDRPIYVLTDGELDDGADLPLDLRDRATFATFRRDSVPDYALTRASGPARVTTGDSIPVDVEARSLAGAPGKDLRLVVSVGTRELGSRTVRLTTGGVSEVRVAVPSRGLAPGTHVLVVHLESGDAESRTDTRLVMVAVTETPGIVLIATPGDWDARALYRALGDVAQLPVRGYVELEQGRYRGMHDLHPVSEDVVRRAARGADLLVLLGDTARFSGPGGARSRWLWLTGSPQGQAGDWYVSSLPGTPVSGALLGLPVDSFAPATSVVALEPPAGSWVALAAQNLRRGPKRPIAFGSRDGRPREVTVAATGLWRWAFRGGPAQEAYRSWVAATVSWLLSAPDTAAGAARLAQAVVQRGRPLVFEWNGAGPPGDIAVGWTSDSSSRTDTLHFDGSGRALSWLAPGVYGWRLAGGGAGRAAVEQYSDEWLPRAPSVSSAAARMAVPLATSAVRDWTWLFGVAIAALALEWWFRRRRGLR